MNKRWIVKQDSYEPPFKTKKWGSPCVVFIFTNKKITRRETKENPPMKYFHDFAIKRAEKSNQKLWLFPSDIDYRNAIKEGGE